MKRAREPAPPASDIMTIALAAEYLQCHPATLYRLLHLRSFPGFHLGGDWRLRRADIDAWIAAREMKVPSEEPKAGEDQRPRQPARKKRKPTGPAS